MFKFLTAGMSSKKSGFYLATRLILESIVVVFIAQYVAEYIKNSKKNRKSFREVAREISEYFKKEGKLKIFVKFVRTDQSDEKIIAREVFCEERGNLKKLDTRENNGAKEVDPNIVKNYRIKKLDQNSLFFKIAKEAIFVVGHALRIAPIYGLMRIPLRSFLAVAFNFIAYIGVYKFFEKIYKHDASHRFEIKNIVTGKTVESNYKKEQNRVVDSVAATITGYVRFFFNLEKSHKAENVSESEYICFDLEETPLATIDKVENIELHIEDVHNYAVRTMNQLIPHVKDFGSKIALVFSEYTNKISASNQSRH